MPSPVPTRSTRQGATIVPNTGPGPIVDESQQQQPQQQQQPPLVNTPESAYTVEGFEGQTQDFGATDIAEAFASLSVASVSSCTTSRATALLNYLRAHCATSTPRPGAKGGKAVDILKLLHGEAATRLIPDVELEIPDPPQSTPTTVPTGPGAPSVADILNGRTVWPTTASPLQAAGQTPLGSTPPPVTSRPPVPQPAPPSPGAVPHSGAASSDLVRLGVTFAQQIQRQAHASVSLFVGGRQWASVRNRREAETWAYVLDELVKLFGWGIADTMPFEAATRRLAALTEVDSGEDWATMADVELIPAGTMLLPDAIRKAMMNRAKVETSRARGSKGGRGGNA